MQGKMGMGSREAELYIEQEGMGLCRFDRQSMIHQYSYPFTLAIRFYSSESPTSARPAFELR